MTKAEKIAKFNPSGIGLKNGHFAGLPFTEEDASIILLPVPWDVTASYNDGTSTGPQNILECSAQLDLHDPDVFEAWKIGIYMRHLDLFWLNRNQELRPEAETYIDFLENGGDINSDPIKKEILSKINDACGQLKKWVFEESLKIINSGKKVGIIGGEHSVPLGYLEALTSKYRSFGVLQIDAHQNLKKAYEGFIYSHASLFNNALSIDNISQLIQVGVRDFSEEEFIFSETNRDRIKVWTDQKIMEAIFQGNNFYEICQKIIAPLPHHVYISFDIDGLTPDNCPNTGTPVPGGLSFSEVIFLIKTIVESGREIIGFDLCEVAGLENDWDGNVGARVLYKLCNFMGKSTKS
jgi:agmatinase